MLKSIKMTTFVNEPSLTLMMQIYNMNADDLKEVCAAFDYEQIENIKKNKIIERLASERINYEE